ncbi:fumarylacetoacetate hydrolase family protein [Streptomyces sp. BH105]|uniref:fumarylacetoacetate hydrolase family protein n=1 Tax=Streptomyces sp. BH105 TaxID=3410408 RepID=UPI003CEF866A
MKLATIRLDSGTAAVRVDGATAVETGFADVGSLLRHEDWRDRARQADGSCHDSAGLDYAPLVPRPSKIICVGLNYRSHILETGQEIPEYPTLFAKFAPALIGAYDDIELPSVVEQMDWEAELGLVVGARVRHADAEQADRAIAGFTVINDVSARDWQLRTLQWLQGKTFEGTTPIGPHLVCTDPGANTAPGEISCDVSGELMQKADTDDLVFGPAQLISYISTILTLEPGDVIATGTPGGVGMARSPQRFLTDGDMVVTRVEGVGELRNTCRRT